jgi:ubiquinone/menaquinone biosynthesis C-methylase UbiE
MDKRIEISRVNRSKLQSRLAYDRMSRWYDLISGGSERRLMELGIRQLAPQPGDHILEIGCGTGHGLAYISKTESTSKGIIGLDISHGMLKKTRQLLQNTVPNESIKLQLGDACHLPYANGIFSAIFLSFIIELIDTPDIPMVLSECKRVLKLNGRVCIVCLEKQDRLSVRIYEMAHKLLPSLVDCRPILIQSNLLQSGFLITSIISKTMWGLPVNIVTARVKYPELKEIYE